jgi:hypothetical protein
MSIVALKRKTQTQYHNMSVGAPHGFSLNGTHRSQGYIGQTSMSRTLVRTLAKGTTLRGHGGCCGKYPIKNIITSPDMSTLENPAIVKSSVINTNGLLLSKYRWIRRPHPFSIVKTTDAQSDYIDQLAKRSIICDASKNIMPVLCRSTCNPAGIVSGARNYQTFSKQAITITKPDTYTGAMNASDYLRLLNKKCGLNDTKPKTNTKNTPFACGM